MTTPGDSILILGQFVVSLAPVAVMEVAASCMCVGGGGEDVNISCAVIIGCRVGR